MRFVCLFFLISTAFATPRLYANGSPRGEFTLEITASQQQGNSSQWDFANHSAAVVRSGAIVVVAIRKTNTSNREILKLPSPNMDYDWTVRSPSGEKLVPRSADSRDCWITGGGPAFLKGSKDMFLQPGQSMVDVSRLGLRHLMGRLNGVINGCESGFDMRQPGTYTVQVAQHISGNPNSPEIQSNIITVTVLPAEKAQP